jgi:hypothetical protein
LAAGRLWLASRLEQARRKGLARIAGQMQRNGRVVVTAFERKWGLAPMDDRALSQQAPRFS